MNTKTSLLTRIAYVTAIALAVFSGGVSTYGLTKLAPGAEMVVAAMGLLFEAGKLTAFATLHHRMPAALKAALLAVGLVLMSLNIVGVSGFLSNAYETREIAAHAASHTAQAAANASVALLKDQLAQADNAVTAARAAKMRTSNHRREKMADDVIKTAMAERDALAAKLTAAQTQQARAEGQTIAASGEFAFVTFLATVTGTDQDRVAHLFILVIASLPDILAVLLLVAAGYTVPMETASAEAVAEPVAPVKAKPSKAQKAARKGWETRRRNEARKTGPQLAFTK